MDRHTRHPKKTPDFEENDFFGQLKRVLVLELPPAPQLNLTKPTTLILALIQEARTRLNHGIHFYKEFGAEEVVDLKTLQCVVGRVRSGGEWAIIDRSDMAEMVD